MCGIGVGRVCRMWGPCLENLWTCPQDQNERPNDSVLFIFLSYNFDVSFCIWRHRLPCCYFRSVVAAKCRGRSSVRRSVVHRRPVCPPRPLLVGSGTRWTIAALRRRSVPLVALASTVDQLVNKSQRRTHWQQPPPPPTLDSTPPSCFEPRTWLRTSASVYSVHIWD